jgi:Arc/MetJ-type ribon-helix-helix transcriptional regulator
MGRSTSINLDDHETQLSALRAALITGEVSGEPEPFDVDAFIATKKSSSRATTQWT